MPELIITAVAYKAGIRPSTLRYYEKIGLLRKRREAGRPENWFLGGRIRISSEFANAAGALWSLRMRTRSY
jgi:hypothetical protein